MFCRGDLVYSQAFASTLVKRFRFLDEDWAERFAILEAESAAWRGFNQDALDIISRRSTTSDNNPVTIKSLAIAGLAHAHLQQFDVAGKELMEASRLCSTKEIAECGTLLRAQGGTAAQLGDFREAQSYFIKSLESSRRFHQRWDEAAALMNLGANSIDQERFDQAIDWFVDADRIARQLSAKDILMNIEGNLGVAYYKLGDTSQALHALNEAERIAFTLGDTYDAIAWSTDAGAVYQDLGNLPMAADCHRRSLNMAKKIKSKRDIVTAIENLIDLSISGGKISDAIAYLEEVKPLIKPNESKLDVIDVKLSQAKIYARQRQLTKAENIFRDVNQDPASPASVRMIAQHELARSLELGADNVLAGEMYVTALETFESTREQLAHESSRLPFAANATRIYDDYIHFLMAQGRVDEALRAADQSRARTLAQGLGTLADTKKARGLGAGGMDPEQVARRAGATLLFYWLGERESYLWVVTAKGTKVFTLASRKELSPLIARYRRSVMGVNDPLQAGDADGRALYRMLVAPASDLIAKNGSVMVLADGELSELNFETLIAPGAGEGAAAKVGEHYWIEDVTVASAPSIAMLAAGMDGRRGAAGAAGRPERMLLVGDPVAADKEYPQLPLAADEMAKIERHFGAQRERVLARGEATPAAYLGSDPKQFGYIHFVSHGVASSTDPLDSAIILSRDAKASGETGGDGFKLYAREIMQHPIDARLVTISACYGSGARAYVGEGLVGLSWAFLRAGAHNTIGALWEASDRSTPQLMDVMYAGIERGETPAVALRGAKLELLHAKGNFRKPFYWAPFQLYSRM